MRVCLVSGKMSGVIQKSQCKCLLRERWGKGKERPFNYVDSLHLYTNKSNLASVYVYGVL